MNYYLAAKLYLRWSNWSKGNKTVLGLRLYTKRNDCHVNFLHICGPLNCMFRSHPVCDWIEINASVNKVSNRFVCLRRMNRMRLRFIPFANECFTYRTRYGKSNVSYTVEVYIPHPMECISFEYLTLIAYGVHLNTSRS